ncbi:transposase, partial [uncultured Lactobacillus sp.]|uniref:transposase n=1 Tax=uncultured Lactobacillus sp. TaxID=153152 RepID=UPI00260126A9
WGGHLWSSSYYIGTVGNMSKDTVERYINDQVYNAKKAGKPESPPIKNRWTFGLAGHVNNLG